MADKAAENVDVVSEEVKEKEVADSPAKEDATEEKEKNGDVCEAKNGKAEKADDDVDSKEPELVCPVKRKSAGGDAQEATPAEGVSPEKKAKLDEVSADAESNGEAEVAA